LITPLFYGTSDMLTWDAATLLDGINRQRLYKDFWLGGFMGDEEYERNVLTDFDPAFEALRLEIVRRGLIDARGYYGIWPVFTKGKIVFLLDPSDFSTDAAQFAFPRIKQKEGRSIADWFRPESDVVAFLAVTIGRGCTERSREYAESKDANGMDFYCSRLGCCITKMLSDKITTEIRRAMCLKNRNQGTAYAFGKPGLPGLRRLNEVLQLLCAEERLGITLDSDCRLAPKHSSVKMFIHHAESEHL
jgi:cobalamin-dependent methionine synthase I